jgi:L,D-peptidoglycan transpeptidase YkuD (ErfK/YbiS/YcfS/YnhG family)
MDLPTDLIVENGTLRCGALQSRCVVGRGGVTADKREGDGATPCGRFPLRLLLFRPDRLQAMTTGLPVRILQPNDGWCDEPGDVNYNRQVKRPYAGRHEALWRNDPLYDLMIVIGYNDDPVIAGKGSAIFIHVAPQGDTPTDGCVGLALSVLLKIAALCQPTTHIDIRLG